MSYLLSKDELSKSAYYCAAGIDLQPLLRFSDIIKNYIYVTVGISKKDLIKGIEDTIANIQSEADILELICYEDFEISQIEHTQQSKLLPSKPEYLNNTQWNNYMDNFLPLARNAEHYYLHFKFKRKIGNIIRELNLFYLVGEALATYDVLYVRQNIAPKLFISIQTGQIEFPNLFSKAMFEGHIVRPRIWLRGVWEREWKNNEVFNVDELFDKKIGEFLNWDAALGVNIEGITNPKGNNNTVEAFGEEKEWNNVNEIAPIEGGGINIQKLFTRFDTQQDSRDVLISSGNLNSLRNDSEQVDNLLRPLENREFVPPLLMVELIEIIKYLYSYHSQKNKEVTIAIIPMGFEDEWEYVKEFANAFNVENNAQLNLNFYYLNPLDYDRP